MVVRWGSCLFNRGDNLQGFFSAVATDHRFGAKITAHFRAGWIIENGATIVG
jgi:hypothetical protein